MTASRDPVPTPRLSETPPEGRTRCRLLVVGAEPSLLETLDGLPAEEFEVRNAGTVEAGRQAFSQGDVDLILTGAAFRDQTDAALLDWARENYPRTIRLLAADSHANGEAMLAVNSGWVDRCVFWPWRPEEVLQMLRRAAREAALERGHAALLEQVRARDADAQGGQGTRGLQEVVQQLAQQNKVLERLALTDALTGLANRRAMDRLASAELRRRARYPGALTLSIMDVDDFKGINARYLLPGGDQVLIGLARVLAASVRTVDTVGRIGGDEFMVLAPATGTEGAVVLGERIRAAVAASAFTYQEQTIRVALSIGVAVAASEVLVEYDEFKHEAAAALEEAKAAGRNRCVVRAAGRLHGRRSHPEDRS